MKKLLFLLTLCGLLALLLTSCGDGSTGSTTPSASSTPTQSTTVPASSDQQTTPGTSEPEPPAPHTHKFGDWTIVKAATKKEAGLKRRVCECGEKEEVSIPYTPKQYTVTFYTNGGSAVASLTRQEDSLIEAPQAPSRDGYRFVCWCTDAALTTAAEFPLTLTQDISLYAKWNTQTDIMAYLKTLLSEYQRNPYSYLPETMRPGGVNVSDSALRLDYTTSVPVASMPHRGYGEQWHMILDNLQQSMQFFTVLQAIDSVSSSSVAIFQNYIDKNPSDTAHHTFLNGIYQVTIDFDGSVIRYVLDFTANFPVFGEQTAQIALSMQIATQEKTVRIQLGDANALTYTMTENSYTFAIRYLGVRTAYFTFHRAQDGTVTGQINEHLTYKGKGIHSSADFYIGERYVSAVGNKASGLIGFKGYINEVYDVKTGQLCGYEVRETATVIGKTFTFHTLWFDLSDVAGISSVTYQPSANGTDACFYINGSATAWQVKKVSTLNPSRRFDIEMRTQYYYVYDAQSKQYQEVAVQVPMLFVQAEYLQSLTKDVASVNKNVNVSITMQAEDLAKIQADYATLIDLFISHKDAITEDFIRDFIGAALSFPDISAD